jgi:hypothetical protein
MRPVYLLLALVTLVTSPAAAPAAERLTPRIVNGVLSFSDPTAGALLFGPDPDHAQAFCSGTLIGCSTFVTAAHCVCNFDGQSCQTPGGEPDPAEWLVFFQHAGFFDVASIAVNPGFDFPSDDVAVVTLAQPVSGITPTPLAAQDPPNGTDATIVGFGRTGGGAEDYGLKQRGSVVTSACSGGLPPDLVCWDFTAPVGPPGTDSNTCNGDSGGPLFVDVGGTRVLAGVTSGGSSGDCLPSDESYDTSVAAQSGYIQTQAGGDLGGASCGSLSQVGDAATQVIGFTQTLDAGKTEGRHSFDVPAGVTELRVALHASEDLGADVDLYVRPASPPTTAEWDCRAFGPNQWGFCEFDAPAEGTWHVLVNRFSGASTYQVTATLFSGQGEPPPPPPTADPQSYPQRRCLNGLAEAGERVARAQGRDAGACLHAFARGQVERLGRGAQPRTAEACLTNDVSGDVARALDRTLRRDSRRCLARPEQLPDFAYRGAGPVNGAARGQTEALAEDLFGPDLDGVLVSVGAAPGSAACQEALAESSGEVLDAGARLAAQAKREALRGERGAAPVASADALELALLDAFARDPRGRLARARAHLQREVVDHCVGAESPFAALFPGVCAGAMGTGELAACADRASLCRLCQALNAMDGLDLDCDGFDDAVPNLTCP